MTCGRKTLTFEGKDGDMEVRITVEDGERGVFGPVTASILIDGPQWTQLIAKVQQSRKVDQP